MPDQKISDFSAVTDIQDTDALELVRAGANKKITGADLLAAIVDTLGLGALGASLLDDADAGTALTTLGVSAFIQTLLNDADAATARSTLGVSGGGGMILVERQVRASTGDFSFTSLPDPANYENLLAIIHGRSAAGDTNANVFLTFNNATSSEYNTQRHDSGVSVGNASSPSSGLCGLIEADTSTANYAGMNIIQIPSFGRTGLFRNWFGFGGRAPTGGGAMRLVHGWWADTSAITRVDFITTSGFLTGSVCSLYAEP